MNFDWTTFLLEIVNFFILLWILRRFLYRPVLQVIETRRQKIAAQLQDADQARQEAAAARAECEQNLSEWEKEKARLRAELEQEIAGQREHLLARLNEEIAETRAKREAQEERERQEWTHMTEHRALELGGQFVVRLLERVASPELETHLLRAALEDLEALPEVEAAKLRAALSENSLEITTAFPLPPEGRSSLVGALGRLASHEVHPTFREDPALLAGLRVHAGPWVLNANLRDELKFFHDGYAHDAN